MNLMNMSVRELTFENVSNSISEPMAIVIIDVFMILWVWYVWGLEK